MGSEIEEVQGKRPSQDTLACFTPAPAPLVPAGPALHQTHHRYIDVSKCEVVHGKVGCDLHGHGGHDDCIVPELGVVQDIGQADEGHVLGEWEEKQNCV